MSLRMPSRRMFETVSAAAKLGIVKLAGVPPAVGTSSQNARLPVRDRNYFDTKALAVLCFSPLILWCHAKPVWTQQT
jgi:hypothetical protein